MVTIQDQSRSAKNVEESEEEKKVEL